ncbi:MAG: PDR/VanB family oxidoreductase [Catenulispora sp.]
MSTSTAEYEDELVVDRRSEAADGVITLTLRHPDGRDLPSWQPGAHIDLLLDGDFDGELVRQYSLCGNPADRRTWQVAVLREPAGRGGSAFVHDKLTEGTTVRVRGPRNHFPLRPARRYLFIAGGIGITPILPMIAEAESAGARWTLLYGGRTRASMAFRDRLAEHGAKVLIQPQDECGLLDLASHLAEPVEDDDVHVYCCGPEPLLAAVEERCRAWPAGSLHMERFQPRAADPEAVSTDFEVTLARSGRTVAVPAGVSVLEAVRAAGVQVLYSCTEGTCGTCETDVLEGIPDHRDSVLTEAEQAAGDTMMICVSRCKGSRLVLDL